MATLIVVVNMLTTTNLSGVTMVRAKAVGLALNATVGMMSDGWKGSQVLFQERTVL
jgi:hypothetical protein